MYQVQSKTRNDDMRLGWVAHKDQYFELIEAMKAMTTHAETNPNLMHRVVLKVDAVIALMPELDTSYQPSHWMDALRGND